MSRFFTLLKSLFTKKEPDAAQAWKMAGGEAVHPYWMYAAPVHLTLGRDNFFLAEPAPLPLSNDEAQSLIDGLNAHFSETNGLYFYAKEGVWYLGLAHDPEVNTIALTQVLNQDIASSMPTGNGALAWAKLQNEIQMLLYQHPVNQARESAGKPVVSSIWCYGLGKAVRDA